MREVKSNACVDGADKFISPPYLYVRNVSCRAGGTMNSADNITAMNRNTAIGLKMEAQIMAGSSADVA